MHPARDLAAAARARSPSAYANSSGPAVSSCATPRIAWVGSPWTFPFNSRAISSTVIVPSKGLKPPGQGLPPSNFQLWTCSCRIQRRVAGRARLPAPMDPEPLLGIPPDVVLEKACEVGCVHADFLPDIFTRDPFDRVKTQ